MLSLFKFQSWFPLCVIGWWCAWTSLCFCVKRRPYSSSYFFLHALSLSVLFPRVFLTRKSACTFHLLVLAYYGIKHARWACRDSIPKHEKEVAPFCYGMFSQSLQQRKRSEVCLVLVWVMALVSLQVLRTQQHCFLLHFVCFFFFGILQAWAC